MKILSDNAVTKHDLDEVNKKQDRQIRQLRIALVVGFLLNAAIAVGLALVL